MIGQYAFRGGQEYLLEIRRARGLPVLIIPPLFDEANRMRRQWVEVMRRLDKLGIDSLLPDLPGTNESSVPLSAASMADWRDALAALPFDRPIVTASVRGGALLDHAIPVLGHWRLAPAKGAGLLRNMVRTKIASDTNSGIRTGSDEIMATALASGVELAGNRLSAQIVADLQAAVLDESGHIRTVGLSGDDSIIGSPLWLRAEPDYDPAMADAMARDIAEWSARCAAI